MSTDTLTREREAVERTHSPRRRGLFDASVGLMLVGLGLVVAAFAVGAPESFSVLVLLAAVGIAFVLWGLSSPLVAALLLLGATFLRLALPENLLPVEPFFPAFGGLILSVLLWMLRNRAAPPRLGMLGIFIALYATANFVSIYVPHEFGTTYPSNGEDLQVFRLVLIGVVMPLVALVLGMTAFTHERALRVLVFGVMAFAAYSAFVSIMQFFGPLALVWPRYIITSPGWSNRAVGVFNQPVVNGLVLVLGYLAGMLVASRRGERLLVRLVAAALVPACVVGVYLTYTRATWLSFAMVVVGGVVLARGWRRGFAWTLAVMVIGVAANWSTFTSEDRSDGGVGSSSEVHDRMNMIATSIWALQREPIFGWGIGRFPSVNTFHHQQWSPSIPWERGFGFASHFDALGVAVELGFVGLALWVLTMGSILAMLLRAVRVLPADRLYDRPMALFALLALLSWLLTGLTVDLRFFDFPNLLVMLLVGAVIGRASTRSEAWDGR